MPVAVVVASSNGTVEENFASPKALFRFLHARIEVARRQLERTAKTVDQIAENCGFGSTAVMRRAFNRLLGTTPAQYRRALRVP